MKERLYEFSECEAGGRRRLIAGERICKAG